MNKKKVRLNYQDLLDVHLLGIASYEKDYRLIWHISNALGLTFTRTANLKLYNPKTNTDQEFINYRYRDEDRYLTYRFLSNRSGEGFLLGELKNIDYLILVEGEVDEGFISNLRTSLTNLENVQGVFTIKPGDLKNWQRLVSAF